MTSPRTISRPADVRRLMESGRRDGTSIRAVLIQLADGPIALSPMQWHLLLFFADEVRDPPRRIVLSNYRVLQDHGFIEAYTRDVCGKVSVAYRITARGRAASDLTK